MGILRESSTSLLHDGFNKTINLLSKLTGQSLPQFDKKDTIEDCALFALGGLGQSQFNELLLTLGYDRVTPDFFNWLFDKTYDEGKEITCFEELEGGIDKFCKTAMVLYGHIKYAFKRLSQMDKLAIENELRAIAPIEKSHYTKRHKPLHQLGKIIIRDYNSRIIFLFFPKWDAPT